MTSEAVDIHLQEKMTLGILALAVGLVMLGIAFRKGLFRPFVSTYLPVIRGIDVIKGFTFFLFIEIFLVPAIAGLILTLKGENLNQNTLDVTTKGWINFWIIVGGFIGVVLAYLELTVNQRHLLWSQSTTPWYHHVIVGIASWFVSYPLVLAFSQFISLIVAYLFQQPAIEQIAVQHVRQSLVIPWLFGLMAFAVVILVPITEEFLFRGLLQSWLKNRTHHPILAIVLSSLLFTGFHYSSSQGLANIELLSALFLLSCMIGFIYERQRSLFAPIALHSFFNFTSLLLIFQEGS